MPKTKKRPDDVPIWDALVVELGDPRPYIPTTEVGTVTITDEPCVDDAGFDDALSDLDDAVESTVVVLESLEVEGRHDAQVVVDEFRERHGIVPPVDLVLQDMLDQTVVMPVLHPGERTLRIVKKGEPEWPS